MNPDYWYLIVSLLLFVFVFFLEKWSERDFKRRVAELERLDRIFRYVLFRELRQLEKNMIK